MKPVAPVTKYDMSGAYCQVTPVGQPRPRTDLLVAAPEHDLVPAGHRGPAALLLDLPARWHVGLVVRRGGLGRLLAELGVVGPGGVVQERLDRRLGAEAGGRFVVDHLDGVVAERQILLGYGGQPAPADLLEVVTRRCRTCHDLADQPAGVVVVEDHVVARGVVGELGGAASLGPLEPAGECPAAVLTAPGIPVHGARGDVA